jgi:hypothetical protein
MTYVESAEPPEPGIFRSCCPFWSSGAKSAWPDFAASCIGRGRAVNAVVSTAIAIAMFGWPGRNALSFPAKAAIACGQSAGESSVTPFVCATAESVSTVPAGTAASVVKVVKFDIRESNTKG